MTERPASPARRRALRALTAAALAAGLDTTPAQEPRPVIYSCTSQGKHVDSDRPIANCEGE